MLEWLAAGVPLLPIAAAVGIAAGLATRRLRGEASEAFTRRLSLGAVASSAALLGLVIALRTHALLPPHVNVGTWIGTGRYRVECSFTLDALSLSFAALVVLLGGAVLRFAASYLHREPGFHRCFLVLSLFIGAMSLLALSGNGAMAFAGWEIAGACSFLLIAYAHDRTVAARNAARAFITNRVGDIGFLLALQLSIVWIGDLEWPKVFHAAGRLQPLSTNALALCFLLAASAKSAQVPFTSWLARAMEGPTPSSALFYGGLMIHAGAYLVLRLQPVFEHAPVAMTGLILVGTVTALYAFLTGLTQTDIKSALMYATVAQVGLIFVACGLGWWTLATVHLFAHAVVRGFQFSPPRH